MYLDSNRFEDCYSNTTGGAIAYTYYQPTGIDSNTFIQNRARLYGNNIASVPQKILLVTKEFYLQNIDSEGDQNALAKVEQSVISSHQSGGQLKEIYIGIFDMYNILCKNINEKELVVEAIRKTGDKYNPTINGNAVFSAVNGLFNITGIQFIATPDSNQTLIFSTTVIDDSIPSNREYLDENGLEDSDLEVQVNMRK